MEVLDSGSLSGFTAVGMKIFRWGNGERFEKAWSEKFEVKHSVSVRVKHIWLICSDGSYWSVS